MQIGVLALQGGFLTHIKVLAALGHQPVEVRRKEQLSALDGLILPGGESSAQRRLMDRFQMGPSLDNFVASGRPVLATCAGAIVAAARGWVDVEVRRNGWGRQLASFDANVQVVAGATSVTVPMRFIRAPRFGALGSTKAIAWLSERGQEIVGVGKANLVLVAGHPELLGELGVHRLVF